MAKLERYRAAGQAARCRQGQINLFLQARIPLQPSQLLASAAAGPSSTGNGEFPFWSSSVIFGHLWSSPKAGYPHESASLPRFQRFIGKLFAEAELLAVAKQYQDATDFHRKHPELK